MTDERKQESPVVSKLDHMQGGFIQGTVKSGDVKQFRHTMKSDKNKGKVDGTLLALGGASNRSSRRFRGLEESPRTHTGPSQGAEARDPTTTLLPPSLTLIDKVPEDITTKGAVAQGKATAGKTKVGPDTIGKLNVKPESSVAGNKERAAKTPPSGCCLVS